VKYLLQRTWKDHLCFKQVWTF